MIRRALLRAGVLVAAPALALSACTSSGDGGGSGSAGAPSGTGVSASPSTAPSTVPAPSASSGSSSGVQRPSSTPTTPVRTTTAPTGPQTSQTTKRPVPLSSPVTFTGRVTGAIAGIRSVTVKSVQPGEIGGPALAVTIRLTNGSARAIDLSNTVVNLAYGADRTPGSPLSGPPSKPFPDSLAAGRSTTGTYTFRVPRENQDDLLTLDVSYSPDAPAVVFSGRR